MTDSRKYFGTDGIRGRIGSELLQPEFLVKLGWAAGKVLAREKGISQVLVGKDTRLSGYLVESSLEAGLSAAGMNVCLLGPMPTPAIAFLTKTMRAQAGVVVSASHNPYQDNGIKFFGPDGMKLSDELELEIERYIDLPLTCVDPSKLGRAHRLNDATGRYVQFSKSLFPSFQSLSGLKIVLDCAHGACYQVAPLIFSELGARVQVIGASPNGFNINNEYGATELRNLQHTVVEMRADFGLAFDGDGDRLMMVNHEGVVVDGDDILYILAANHVFRGQAIPGVVGTVMSNLGLEQALDRLKIPFLRSPVGDRHVSSMLKEKGWFLGGEPSGHILNLHLTTTGDGISAALQVLSAMQMQEKSLKDLCDLVKRPHVLINVPLKEMIALNDYPAIDQSVKALSSQLGKNGRVLLRTSGTELCVRVMVEEEDARKAREHAEDLVEVVVQALGVKKLLNQ